MEEPRGGERILAPLRRRVDDAVLSPATFAASEARAVRAERRLTRSVLVLWLVGWLVGGTFFVANPDFRGTILVPVAIGMVAILGALLLAARWLLNDLIGAVWVIASSVAVVLVSASLGPGASMDLYLFPIGFASFLVVSSAHAPLRTVLVAIAASLYAVSQFFPEAVDALPPDVVVAVSRYNNVVAMVAVVVLAFVVQRRFLATWDTLTGVRRYVERRATTDELTGLLNRRPVRDGIERLIRQGRQDHAVAIIDLDDFKPVNDALGHLYGDDVLRAVAELLASEFRDGDLVARWGGDEFLVVMQRVQRDEAVRTLERVRQKVARATFTSGGIASRVSLSIGFAMGGDADGVTALVAAADAAMYRAKRDGRNRVVRYDPRVDEPAEGPGAESRGQAAGSV